MKLDMVLAVHYKHPQSEFAQYNVRENGCQRLNRRLEYNFIKGHIFRGTHHRTAN